MKYFLLFPCNATDFVGFVYILLSIFWGFAAISHYAWEICCFVIYFTVLQICVAITIFSNFFKKKQNKQTRHHFNFKIK
jgi:ABC-type multidrug transport system permease subunit